MKLVSQLNNSGQFPKPGNPETAKSKYLSWNESCTKLSDDLKLFFNNFNNSAAGQSLLSAIFGNSPYLTQIIFKEPEFFKNICEIGFDKAFEVIISDVQNIDFLTVDKKSLMKKMRKLKQKCSLLVAVADISQSWNLTQVTGKLSEFADEVVKALISHLFIQAAKNKLFKLPDTKNPHEKCGLVVLALGKLGSKELNYSSDIDLVCFYDEQNEHYIGRGSISQFYVGIVQEMSEMLQSRTEDGYVFRTDLRLRPDPGATPLAVAISSSEHYYETVGQNWERAAMIKARFIAGDDVAGKRFLQFLGKYVWRKYLDFASIQDIHSIKRQIDSKIGELPENLYGYNIKLGHGGIREIEFYVQTQQLIWGGREPDLQISDTRQTLKELLEKKRISITSCEEMTSAYELYRHIEHRLQMVGDQQTHTLPDSKEKLAEVAIFCGFKDDKEFIKTLKETILKVKGHYSELFAQSPSLASGEPGFDGSLVFTGTENDPATLKTLEKMGFTDTNMISETVRGWHHGRRRSTRTKKAREILTEIMPSLLKAFSQSVNPDMAFKRFDDFLTHLPAGVQLFSLCFANPQIMELIAEIMGGYPYIANNLSRNPSLLEYVLTSDFYGSFPTKEELKKDLEKTTDKLDDIEEILNNCRIWTHDRQFRVGVQLIKGKINAQTASQCLSDIADVVLTILYDNVSKYFSKQYGTAKGYDFAAIAMGKLGSCELTFASDIDLVFVFGKKSSGKTKDSIDLSPNEYFTRLARRYLTAISAMTNQGKLYEVDTRLRPSGNDGPLVSSFEAYSKYYDESAWRWELMALTRARVLFSTGHFKTEIEDLIFKKLTRKDDKKKLIEKIEDIRQRTAKAHGTKNIFYVKHVAGGLVDLEYILQFLELLHAHRKPDILKSNTRKVIESMAANKIITATDAKLMNDAYTLYQKVQAVLRLMDNETVTEGNITEAMKKILVHTTAVDNFETLKKNLEKSQKNVQKLYDKYLRSN